MRRILIVGSSGAGKSTLAQSVARRFDLPLIHLDRHYWQPGWVPSEAAVFRAGVAALAAGESWVMDGNDASTLDLRLPRADLLVLVDLPWPLCLARVVRRRWDRRAAGRPTCPPAAPNGSTWTSSTTSGATPAGPGPGCSPRSPPTPRSCRWSGCAVAARSDAGSTRCPAAEPPGPFGRPAGTRPAWVASCPALSATPGAANGGVRVSGTPPCPVHGADQSGS